MANPGLFGLLWVLAGPPAPAPPPPPELDPQAQRDVETLLRDSSLEYLRARGRLVADPSRAAPALLARLEGEPPLTSAERRGLLAVLAELGDPSLIEYFAQGLARSCAGVTDEAAALAALAPWRALLGDQGQAATEALLRLAADGRLLPVVRAELVADLVRVVSPSRLGAVIERLGPESPGVRRAFARALVARGIRRPDDRPALTAALDEVLRQGLAGEPAPKPPAREPDLEPDRARTKPSPGQVAFLLPLRAQLDPADQGFVPRVADLAKDPALPFATRVGATRALAKLGHHRAAQLALEALATGSLIAAPGRGTDLDQAREILGWLALAALPKDRAAIIVRQGDLRQSPRPRIAAVAWAVADLGNAETWLPAAMANPWPQVRQAALGRVQGPCSPKLLGNLAAQVGAGGHTPDPAPAVRRASVVAVARCGDDRAFKVLAAMLDDGDLDHGLSSEAARQLVRRFGPRGSDAVAAQLARRPEPAYAQGLARALGDAPALPTYATAVLCEVAGGPGLVGRAAREALLPREGLGACPDPTPKAGGPG